MFCTMLGLSPCDLLLALSLPDLEQMLVTSGMADDIFSMNKLLTLPSSILELAMSDETTASLIHNEVDYVVNLLESQDKVCDDKAIQMSYTKLIKAKEELEECSTLVIKTLELDEVFSKAVKTAMCKQEKGTVFSSEQFAVIKRYSPQLGSLEVLAQENNILDAYETTRKQIQFKGARSFKTAGLLDSMFGALHILKSYDFSASGGFITNDKVYFSEHISHWCVMNNMARFTSNFARRLANADAIRKQGYLEDIKGLKAFVTLDRSSGADETEFSYNTFIACVRSLPIENDLDGLRAVYSAFTRIMGVTPKDICCLCVIYCIALYIEHLAQDEALVEDMEAIGLYFLSGVKTDFIVTAAKSLVVFDRSEIVLEDVREDISYAGMVGSIHALLSNDLVPVGASITSATDGSC